MNTNIALVSFCYVYVCTSICRCVIWPMPHIECICMFLIFPCSVLIEWINYVLFCSGTSRQRMTCAESELQNLKSQHILYVEAELWNFKSQNMLCAEAELQVTENSAWGICLVPYAMARMTRERWGNKPLSQSDLGSAVIYCSILAVAPTGICVSFLCYYQAVKNQLTYDKNSDIRQTSWPKAA